MSGDNYTITDQYACYFLTLTIVYWIDLFTRKEYKDIIVDSLNHCSKEKGLEIYGWVLMSNHLHLLARTISPNRMSDVLRDFKKFTSKKLSNTIQEIPESRKIWLLDKFSFEAKRSRRANNYKIWKDDNHPIDIENNNIDPIQKLNYIHENPVRAGIVDEPEHYVYSSAKDYAGMNGLVDIVKI